MASVSVHQTLRGMLARSIELDHRAHDVHPALSGNTHLGPADGGAASIECTRSLGTADGGRARRRYIDGTAGDRDGVVADLQLNLFRRLDRHLAAVQSDRRLAVGYL